MRACGNLEGYNIHKSGSYKEFCEKRIKNGKIIMEQEQEQEDEEDLFEIEIDDVLYLANDDENGILYEMTSDGDVGKKIGIIKDGEPIFQEDKICYIESQFSDTQKYLKQRDYPDEFYDMPIGTKVYGKIWDGQDYQTDEELEDYLYINNKINSIYSYIKNISKSTMYPLFDKLSIS